MASFGEGFGLPLIEAARHHLPIIARRRPVFEEVIGLSNTIIWNGPMGMFEIDLFSKGTFKIAHAIADTYAYTIAGGGDTVNAILQSGEKDNFSFISTGGGASLELLEGKILPGVANLNQLGA